MKKIILILMTLCLFACSKEKELSTSEKLAQLGYSENSISKIETYTEDFQQLFLDSYNEKYDELLNYEDFDINNLEEYLTNYDYFENEQLIQVVNSGRIQELESNEYYIPCLKALYLRHLDEYDSIRDLIEIVNTYRYLPLYTCIMETDVSKNYLMLVNKYHQLPSDYEPDDLVDIDSDYGWGSTRQAVYDAFVEMADDAYEAGYTISITSAYRSYDYQDGLYNKYLSIDEGGQASVDTYSARPGHSEHQSGLCLDLVTPGYSMDDFGLSEASDWVNENCYKYGFIIRYTEDKVNITGYQAEPWQVRYVGSSEIAKDIKDRGISFDEYYRVFVDNEEYK